MANVLYRISSKEINGFAEVLMRFYAGRGLDQRARTHVYVPVSLWNAKKQRLNTTTRFVTQDNVDASALQSKLDTIEKAVLDGFIHDVNAMTPGWLQSVVDEALGRASRSKKAITFAEEIRAFASIHENARTVASIVSTAKSVEKFCEECLEGSELPLLNVNEVMVLRIENYLRNSNAPNTVSAKMRRLRATLNYALKMRHINASPFSPGGAHVPAERYVSPTYLTIAERDALYAFQGLHGNLAAQRDIFIFQCHTGMRVSDLLALTEDNIAGGYLQYVPIKTKQENVDVVRVPLSNTAMEILERYRGGEQILPFISSQKYNDNIRKILKLAGLDRQVNVLERKSGESVMKPLCEVASSHLARRTFAANVYKRTGGNQRVTASMTGHAPNSRSFFRYTEVDDEMKTNAIQATQSG